jgi:transcriptional regulator with XRE-family HTH domain
MKQEALAAELGISQQAISKIEQSENVEDEVLVKIATALGVQLDGLKKFNEDSIFQIINNTFQDSSSNNNNYLCTINPLDKVIELYERLLQSEREKVDLLKNNK